MDPVPAPAQPYKLPSELPMIVLRDCYLFPGCFMPLFIFEDRYRSMLAHALTTHRMFCVGTRTGDDDNSILPWTTAGLVRASVRQDDGTSHVMLYGVSRVNIRGWKQTEPFRIAEVEPLISRVDDAETVHEMRRQALDLLPAPTPECSEAMQMLRATLERMDDCEMVCDILAYHFVRSQEHQTTLLSEPSLEKRYEILLGQLARL